MKARVTIAAFIRMWRLPFYPPGQVFQGLDANSLPQQYLGQYIGPPFANQFQYFQPVGICPDNSQTVDANTVPPPPPPPPPPGSLPSDSSNTLQGLNAEESPSTFETEADNVVKPQPLIHNLGFPFIYGDSKNFYDYFYSRSRPASPDQNNQPDSTSAVNEGQITNVDSAPTLSSARQYESTGEISSLVQSTKHSVDVSFMPPRDTPIEKARGNGSDEVKSELPIIDITCDNESDEDLVDLTEKEELEEEDDDVIEIQSVPPSDKTGKRKLEDTESGEQGSVDMSSDWRNVGSSGYKRPRRRKDSDNVSPPKYGRQGTRMSPAPAHSIASDPAILAVGQELSRIPVDKPGGAIPKLNPGLVHFMGNKLQGFSTGTPAAELSTSTSAQAQSKFNDRPFFSRRKWEKIDMDFGKKEEKKYVQFTLASYNVLAQNLLHDNMDLYEESDPDILTWEYRSQNLFKEIKYYQPDVLCLQEVNEDHFSTFFLPKLTSIGYEGIFKCRTNDKKDGCATFYKTSKFELDDKREVEYFQRYQTLLDRDNVGIVVRLKPRKGNRNNCLVVGNTHLLFNPRRGDIKLAQIQMLVAEMDRMAHCVDVHHNYHACILCGDLNSEPHSAIYNFLLKGYLNYEGLLVKTMSGQKEAYGRGREIYLGKDLLPDDVGITDNCEFFEEAKVKAEEWANNKRLWWKRKELKRLKEEEEKERNENNDEREDGEVSDTEMDDAQKVKSEDVKACDSKDQPSTSKEKNRWEIKRENYDIEKVIEDHLRKSLNMGSGKLRHSLQLDTVYENRRKYKKRSLSQSEWEATTHHGLANCTVDYLFFSQPEKYGDKHGGRKLRLLSRLKLPTCGEMSRMGDLPNENLSSDHVILLAKFALKCK